MINFKLLLLISFCFILSKVIGSNEKYSNSTVNDNKLKTNDHKIDDKSNKVIKKNDKLKFKDEKFQVLKAGSDLQLQKNSMQNSFQSVYGQAFIIDNPIDQVTKITNGIKNKVNTKFSPKPTPKTFELPKLPPIKPIITNKEQPLYHFNKKPIVFQCCRYVFPSDLYMDHLMFYSKFGHTYSNENNDNHKSLNPINHLSNQLLPNNDKKEFLEKETLINTDKQNDNEEIKYNDKLMNDKYEKEDDKLIDRSDKLEKIEKLDGGNEKMNEKLNEKLNSKSNDKSDKSDKSNDKSNDKSDDKSMEPDEAATNLFKIWNANSNSKNLYNFGSCIPIYDLSQTNLNFNPSHQTRSFRWPFFG